MQTFICKLFWGKGDDRLDAGDQHADGTVIAAGHCRQQSVLITEGAGVIAGRTWLAAEPVAGAG
jgi:hypothetical protein